MPASLGRWSSGKVKKGEVEVPQIGPGDIIISVMGVTGSGKSTFISHFSKEVEIGYGLESQTRDVQVVPCQLADGTKFYLIDTPGFDDTTRSDVDVLMMISNWLSSAHQSKIQLTGIIYLHRILDPRIGSAAMKNLKMFRKLCGEHGLGSVVLATTMWDGVPPETGKTRETDLQAHDDFWKYMIEQGSRMFRQDKGHETALKIVHYLINKNRPVTLQIQTDMVDNNMTLEETGAGKEVASDVLAHAAEFRKELDELRKEMAEALLAKDTEAQEELRELEAEQNEKILKHNQEILELQRLRANKDEIRNEMNARYEREKAEILKEMDALRQSIRSEELKTQSMVEAHQKDLALQEAKLKNNFYRAILARSCLMM